MSPTGRTVPKASVVDLFCGIGGLSYGFTTEGFDVLAGIDSDTSCKFAFEKNVLGTFLAKDLRDVTGKEVARLFAQRKSRFRILVGCAPCAPFSFYTGRYRKGRRRRDPKWQLLDEFGRLVAATKPDVVSMENVPRIVGHRVFQDFVRDLKSAGYFVTYEKVRADHYGVPQKRSRLVLLASRWGEVRLPSPTHKDRPVTVREAIGGLPAIEAGKPSKRDRLHVTRGLSELNMRRLRATSEGGSWKEWKKELQLNCHKKRSGKSFRSVYGRMKWDEPSPVITTQCLGIGNGRFGHPEQDRAISVREAALLQSFPKSFRFVPAREPLSGLQLARQIGNAVPVKLGRAIARAIKSHLTVVEASLAADEAGLQPRRRSQPVRGARPFPKPSRPTNRAVLGRGTVEDRDRHFAKFLQPKTRANRA